MLQIRPQDFNMPTILGMAVDVLGEHIPNLKIPLYLSAYGNNNGADVFLDSTIPHVKDLEKMIMNRGIDVVIVNGSIARQSPFIGFSKSFRNEYPAIAAKISAFTLFVLNGRINFKDDIVNNLF